MWQAIELVNFKPIGKVLATGEKEEDVIKFWKAGEVCISFTDSRPLKRLSTETLKKRRTTRAKNKLMKKAPLFFDELFKREIEVINKMAPVRN